MFTELVFGGVDAVKHYKGHSRTAVVSILDYSERGYRPDLSRFAAVLMLEFEDVSDASPVLMGKTLLDDAQVGQDRCPHNIEERYCTMSDAQKVVDFLHRIDNDPRIDTVFVHCFAGVSRSAAVAQFVLDAYKVHNASSHRSTEGKNPRLYRLLHAAHQLTHTGSLA